MMLRVPGLRPWEVYGFTLPEISMILEMPPQGMQDVEARPFAGRAKKGNMSYAEIVAETAAWRRLSPKEKLERKMREG